MTYSIVAVDKPSGQMGVAIQSRWFSVGSIAGWAEPGVGVMAIQAFPDLSHGHLGLALMKAGRTPEQTLKSLLAGDTRPEIRQIGIVDFQGRVAAHTGEQCVPEAGHMTGVGFTAQANLMRNRNIWLAMATAFEKSKGPLAYRLMETLEAAQEAGGDVRGKESASMLIVKTTSSGMPWQDRVLDLRVEDHTEPLKELRRLLRIHEAYAHTNYADTLMSYGRMNEATEEFGRAFEIAPEIEEPKFWQAVTVLCQGRTEESIPIFKDVFAINPDWKQVLRSLLRTKLFPINEHEVSQVLGA
jgi:uncharacterized Ntn-hydrolase superfamily protein